MKWLITGAQGFLGSRVVAHYEARHEVVRLTHADVDIADARQVAALVQGLRPDGVIHCAALSDTGYAQQHPDESAAVNLRGTVNVASACRLTGCKLVYMSSDQVYDGLQQQGALPEESALHPANVYGTHKLQAEQQVADVWPQAVGLRLTWMYDLPSSAFRPNRGLAVNLARACTDGLSLRAAVREFRGITCVWDVVERLEACFALPGGVYNFGCENRLNSYDTYCAAAVAMGLPDPQTWITPDTDRFAGRVRNLAMDLGKLRAQGVDFPTTTAGFHRWLGNDSSK